MPRDKKTHRIAVPLSLEEYQEICRQAEREKRTVAGYIRYLIDVHKNEGKEPKMDRKKIAAELHRGIPDYCREDHLAIIAAVERGDSREAILAMPEVDRWPETANWLNDNL